MDRLPTTDVPGWLHTSLQDEVIESGSIPAQDLLSDTQTPVVIRPEHTINHDASNIELFHVSPHHGRSYELGPNSDRSRNRLGKVAVWSDEYENKYTSYSLKGNNFTHSTIMQSSTAPSGYIPMGLLESDALLRVIRSSRLLREAGISTEWISRVFEPQQLIYKGELVSQPEYKRRLLKDTANERGLEEMVKIAAAIEPMTFFITGRSMEINDRLADFAFDSPEEARKRLQRIFAVYNVTHSEDEDFRRLQPARESDRTRFFKKVFPSLLGKSLAQLHNAGMVHTFPTLSNVTILGGLIDLDSIRGEPLQMGDKPLTPSDRANDIGYITDYDHTSLELKTLYNDLMRLGITPHSDFVYAQESLINAYNEIRTPQRLKQDRAIENIVLHGANFLLSGDDALQSYEELSKAEANKAYKIIWNEAIELIKDSWQTESLLKQASDALDRRIEQMSREMESNTTRPLTKETLLEAYKFMAYKADEVDADVRLKYKNLVSKIDDEHDFPKLRSFVPNKQARERILHAIALNTSWNLSEDIGEETGKKKLEEALQAALNVKINEFLANMNPSYWQILAHNYDTFKVVKDTPANRMMVYEQKVVYGFDNINFEELIVSALASNIPIATYGPDYEFSADNYMLAPKGLVGRNAFSDGANYQFRRVNLVDIKRELAGALYRNPETPVTYFAWLCEREDNGEHVLFVDTNDFEAIDILIGLHPSTTSTHIVLDEE